MAIPIQVVIDCHEPVRLARFWAEVLGYEVQRPPSGFSSWEEFLSASGVPEEEWGSASAIVDPENIGPRVYFQRVPESKKVKNRVHLDVSVAGGREVARAERKQRIDEAARRAVALGARQLYEHDDDRELFVTMADPEANEFCLH